jgi:rhodanese-related sulfurtransferase
MKEQVDSVPIPDMMMKTKHTKMTGIGQMVTWISISGCLFMMMGCQAIYENGHELAESIRPDIREISLEELDNLTDGTREFLLIDVRGEHDYRTENIPGSFNIPAGVIEFKIRDDAHWEEEYMYTPANEDTIVLYSQNGDRSALAVRSLTKLGFKHAWNLQGGWEAYSVLNQKESTK